VSSATRLSFCEVIRQRVGDHDSRPVMRDFNFRDLWRSIRLLAELPKCKVASVAGELNISIDYLEDWVPLIGFDKVKPLGENYREFLLRMIAFAEKMHRSGFIPDRSDN
jgi:hypothetical protein